MTVKKGRHLVKKEKVIFDWHKVNKRLLRTLAIILGVIILVGAAGTLYVSAKLNKISYESSKEAEPLPVPSEEVISAVEETPVPTVVPEDIGIIGSSDPPEGDVFVDKDIVNLLLIGTDGALGGPGDPGRADCVMLCSLNKKTGDVKLISFERGISVQFDIYPYSEILTHTYAWGGSALVQEMIEKYFLVDILGYIHVNYDSFITGVDAIGGVDLDLTELEAAALNEETYTNAATRVRVQEGINHLDGYDALQYSRLRFVDSDWVRIERQRNVVQAALRQAKMLSLVQLNNVADKMLPLIETNLSKSDIMSLLFHVPKFIGAETEQMTVPEHIPGDPVVWCHFDRETEKIMTFIYGDKAAEHYNVEDVPLSLVT